MIVQVIGYLMRSGPDSLDLMVATNYAVMAADLSSVRRPCRAPQRHVHVRADLCDAREGVKRVDVDELYDAQEYRPKVRHVTGKPMFAPDAAHRASHRGGRLPRPERGDPGVVAGAAQRHGAEVVGILDGWDGLMDGRVRRLDRDAVRGILQRGGTILGTSRRDPYVHGEEPRRCGTRCRASGSTRSSSSAATGRSNALRLAQEGSPWSVSRRRSTTTSQGPT